MEVTEEQQQTVAKNDNKNEYAKNEEEDGSDKNEDASSAEAIATTNTSTIQAQRKEEQGKNTCLYRGKNFVFDPRRTDPIIGNGISSSSSSAAAATHNSSSSSTHSAKCISTVGKCIICSSPHDDYDNGHAPVLEREVRCCRCRVLVLVCNDCRERVRCWGEEKEEDCEHRATEVVVGGEDAVTTMTMTTTNMIMNRKDLFCGGSKCIDEGNVAEKVELTRF